jgi:hypothetical protein
MKVQGKIKPMPNTPAITVHKETNGKLHMFLSPALELELVNFMLRTLFHGNYRVLPTGNYEAMKGETSLPPSNRVSKQAVSFENQMFCFLIYFSLVD